MEQGEMSDNERIQIKTQQNTYKGANETTSEDNKSDNDGIHIKTQQNTFKGANETTSVDNKSDIEKKRLKFHQSVYNAVINVCLWEQLHYRTVERHKRKTSTVDADLDQSDIEKKRLEFHQSVYKAVINVYQWEQLHNRTVERHERKISSVDTDWDQSDIEKKHLKLQQRFYKAVISDNERKHLKSQQSICKGAKENTRVDNKTRQRIKRNQVEVTENYTKLRKSVDDTLSELLVDQFSTVMKSVGCLMSQYGKGTLFRVGSKYGMTAAHVVVAIINPHNHEKGDCSRLCRDQVYVSFSESGPTFKLAGKVVFLNSFLDVAIVEFRDEIIQDLPPALSILTYSAFLSDVAVIGYGHGNNESKCLEHSVKVIDPKSVPVEEISIYLTNHQETFKSVLKIHGKDSSCVDEGYTGYNDSHRILMNAYLGKGASGSPIFTKADPAALQVVGIFICGYPKMAYELPATSKYLNEYTFEAGTRMDFIYSALKSENQELAEDIFSIK